MKLRHKFVEFIPEEIAEGILYISMDYGTVIHSCACGCGNQVNTPLSPTDWRLIYNGKFVSLKPSVGNWSFECRSHYWITDNHIEWASDWKQSKIDSVREIEIVEKEEYFKESDSQVDCEEEINIEKTPTKNHFKMWIGKILAFFK
jgi:hypothetical protein